MAEREVQHGFCGFTASLVIDGHSPIVFYSRECPFYDPSEGKYHRLESKFFWGRSATSKSYLSPFTNSAQRASIATISMEDLSSENLPASRFITGISPLESWIFTRWGSPLPWESKRICNDMFFPSFDLLTSINSAFLTVYMVRGSYASLSL